MIDVPLGDLIAPARVARAGERQYPVLSMTMHDGLVDQAVRFKKRIASNDLANYKVVRRGQLVVGFPIDEGVLDFQSLYDAGIVSPAYAVWDLNDGRRLHSPYLKRYLRSPRAMAYYRTKLRGSTARRRSLPADVFLALPVPVPSFDEQRRIVAILDQSDALRAKCRQVVAHLDTLTASVFNDMFGTCDKTIPLGRVLESAIVFTDGDWVESKDQDPTGSVRLTQLADVGDGRWLDKSSRFLTAQKAADLRCTFLQAGDVLVARMPDPLGRACIFPGAVQPCVTVVDVCIIRPDIARQHPLWLCAAINDSRTREQINRLATGTTRSRVSRRNLSTVGIYDVPFAAQCEFAARVEYIGAHHAIGQKALIGVNQLFASLQARAFRGGL